MHGLTGKLTKEQCCHPWKLKQGAGFLAQKPEQSGLSCDTAQQAQTIRSIRVQIKAFKCRSYKRLTALCMHIVHAHWGVMSTSELKGTTLQPRLATQTSDLHHCKSFVYEAPSCSSCHLQQLHVNRMQCLRLLLGTEAPVMTPNGKDLSSFRFCR